MHLGQGIVPCPDFLDIVHVLPVNRYVFLHDNITVLMMAAVFVSKYSSG
jgi:hypothetical protein